MAAGVVSTSPELHDVQGLVARGYGNLGAACFLLVGIDDRAAGQGWLGTVAVSLTLADEHPDRRAVNVALTSGGLRKLALDPGVVGQFSNEFIDGMTTAHRSRNLGDVDENAPDRWQWGGPCTPEVDAVLLLYARDEAELASFEREHAGALGAGLRMLARLGTSDLQGHEPFGFRDGISQPLIEGLSKTGSPEITHRFGEFVLGYPNEYGRYTDRPILDPAADPERLLPVEPETRRPDLGRNGTYLVFRQLSQDVHGFWRFLDHATKCADGSSDPVRRIRLAAKMVGRWPGGAPLALAPDGDDPGLAEANDFAYFHTDRMGGRCPIGAHIRRANPRDSLDPSPGTAKSWAINRRHRILRRGREYGAQLTPDEALSEDPPRRVEEERGLHFICLNGNIARQFEFVNNTWLNNPKFAGLYDDADPLVAPSHPSDGTFTVQSAAVRERVTNVPRFVSVRGGAYFFLPGIAATRYLAGLGAKSRLS
jgi:Dyp-type peroxidase family